MNSLHRRARRLLPWALGACVLTALAGCPDSNTLLCPDNTVSVGSFTATLTQHDAPSACRITGPADSGALDAAIFTSSQTFNASLCSSKGSDGGPLLTFALAAATRSGPLADGGVWSYSSSNNAYSGTSCGCDIAITEQISFVLLAAQADAAVAFVDGGLPDLQGFAGTVSDAVTGDPDAGADGGPPCYCNTPCTTTFDLTATK
jgi:hypothetical protein